MSIPRTAALGLLAALVAAPALARECNVLRVEGAPADLWHAGRTVALTPGPLPAGPGVIATGPEARVGILCSDGLTLTVAGGTEVALDALTAPEDAGRRPVLQLLRGLLGLAGAPSVVRTPLMLGATRSIAWAIELTPEGAAIFVAGGQVESVPAQGPPAWVDAGEGRDAPPDAPAGPPTVWGEARVEALLDRLGPDWR